MWNTIEWTNKQHHGQKMKLETVGTVMVAWVLAVRLGPGGFSSAQVQTSTVIHTHAASRVPGCSTQQPCQESTPWCDRISPRLYLLVSLEQPYREDLPAQRLCHAFTITSKHIMYTEVAVHIPCTTFFFRMTLADIENLYPSPIKNHNQSCHSILSRGASN